MANTTTTTDLTTTTLSETTVAMLSESAGRASWKKALLGIGLFCLIFITVAGNVLVLVAFAIEKKLQTLFNYYIVNLAITDLAVGLTAMSFYTVDNILGYWPFGGFMCGLWIFCDYGMTFASVFTLIVISLDRFWSVTWSVHYKMTQSKKRSFISIVVVWVVMVVLWLPACINDRVKNPFADKVCIWEPSLNQEFVVVIAVIGHHGSCLIMLFCYFKVLFFMFKRSKQVGARNARRNEALTTGGAMTSTVRPDDATQTKNNSNPNISVIDTPSTTALVQKDPPTKHLPTKSKEERNTTRSDSKERKAFITLSYVIVGYMICWVPFHLVFDVSAVKPDAVPELLYTITFWMTYINSTINPFLYNFSSPDFRRTFKRILCCGKQ